MLTRFDRYLLRTVFFTTWIALIFLLTSDFIIQISGDSDDLGKGGLTLSILLLKHLLTLPEKFSLFAPAAVLIGTIMGLGQLNAQQEITVVQAAGISRVRIARGVVFFALLVGIVSLVNDEYFAPKMRDKSELIFNQARGRSSDLSRQEGIWLQQKNEIIHIMGLNADGSLHALTFYQFNGEAIEITTAKTAYYSAPDWQLENPRRFRTTPAENIEIPAPSKWKNAPSPANLQQLAHMGNADTIGELYNLTQFMAANGLNHRKESLRLWQMLLMPLTILTMVLLALPFAFGHTRSGQQGTRLVIGIFLGVAYYVVSGILANLALLLGWSSFVGAASPIFIFSFLPLWFLRRH